MTQQFSHSVAACRHVAAVHCIATKVAKLPCDILIMRNIINTHQQWL